MTDHTEKMRKSFDSWAAGNGLSTARCSQAMVFANGTHRLAGDYVSVEVLCAWDAWQVASWPFLDALRAITAQVDENIRPTVRDCVNGQNSVQDIYGYCDQIESIATAAMKEPQP